MKPEYQKYIDDLKKQEDDDRSFLSAILMLFYKKISDDFSMANYNKQLKAFTEIGRLKIQERMRQSVTNTRQIVADFYGVPVRSGDEPYVIMEHYMDNTLDTVLAQLDNFIQTTNVLGANENFNTQWEGLTNNSVKKLMKRG